MSLGRAYSGSPSGGEPVGGRGPSTRRLYPTVALDQEIHLPAGGSIRVPGPAGVNAVARRQFSPAP
jgi:hypothetical protein